MATKRDYYEVLGLSKSATKDDIDRAYRKLARQYHPDLNKAPDAEAKFKEVNEAHEVLSDDKKRALYDQYGFAGMDGSQASGGQGFGGTQGFSGAQGFGGFGGFEDIFSSFFGGGATREQSSSREGADIRIVLSLSFMEAAFGCKKDVTYTRYETCPDCSGTGAQSSSDIKTCARCHGTGRIQRIQNSLFGRIQTESACPDCGGTGKTIARKCVKCGGTGRLNLRRTVTVNIPSGIADGQGLRLNGYGQAGVNGGGYGDLLIEVKVAAHEIFTRNENDILLNLPITFSQAALGSTIAVPTISGTSELKIPAGIQTGTRLRMPGKGIYNTHEERTGDEWVTVTIVTPGKLTKEQKDLFTALSQTDEKSAKSSWQKFKDFFK